MRWLVGLVLLGTPALGAECEHLGTSSLIEVTQWSASVGDPNVLTTVSYRNIGVKPIATLKATVWFFDAVGERVIGFQVDPDAQLEPGDEKEQSGRLIGDEAQRLLRADKGSITVLACVQDVAFTDGTRQTFP